jgi:hypothetical protein
VTDSVLTPFVNVPDVPGSIVPEFAERVTVPPNKVTVLLLMSCAVIVTLNGIVATCGSLMVAIAK